MTAATVYAQPAFVSGYFITRDGQRTDCEVLLSNIDSRDNPKSFQYRTPTVETRGAELANISELGFKTGEVYRRYTVFIDRSSDALPKLTKDRNPEFAADTLFLRVVVSGIVSLYQYDEARLHRFFYAKDQATPKQLVYKRYLTNNGEAAYNQEFKQELLNELQCASIAKSEFENLEYETAELKALIVKFNSCQGGELAVHEKAKSKTRLTHVTIRAGLTYNSLSVSEVSAGFPLLTNGNADLEGPGFRVGLELEAMLPNSRWSIPFEIAYQSFSHPGGPGLPKATYTPIDILLGTRVYFPVSETGKLYLGGHVVFALPSGSGSVAGGAPYVTVTPAFAAGYRIKRFSAEVYFGLARNLTEGFFSTDFSGVAINLGYAFPK